MKHLNRVLIAGSLALLCVPAYAGGKHHGYYNAKVVRTDPVFETVRYPVDEQVCWQEEVWLPRRRSAAPVVIGAVIGGVVGHQFGGGSGKTALTVAGAAVGGAVGNQVSRNHYRRGGYPVSQQRCEVQRNWRVEERIVAWDVAYKVHGNVYHTRMPENPGKRIKLRVGVTPAPYYTG